MGLRPRRRNLVVWTHSASPASRAGASRPGRVRRLRGWIRIAGLLTLVGLMRLGCAARVRWRPLLVGGVLTAIGVVDRNGPGGLVLLPGLCILLSIPLVPASSKADRAQHSKLERELAGYSTPAQRRDLEATLDRYPDEVTRELRDILARQAMAGAVSRRIPGCGPY